MTVAIVIPTFNHARYLADAIRSALGQSRPPDEIVVVDDGSTDAPESVTAAFSTVTLLTQANKGLAAARNLGLHNIRSRFVIFLDADDRLLPVAIEAGLASMKGRPDTAFTYGGYRRIDENGSILGPDVYQSMADAPYPAFLRGNRIGMHATVTYRRELLLESGGFDESLPRCEDYDAYLRLAACYRVASHSAIVAEYRMHADNMSRNHAEMLAWALRVHGRHKAASTTDPVLARAWRDGRRKWRVHYSGEMVRSAKIAWRRDRDPMAAAGQIIRAWRAYPPNAPRTIASLTIRSLPDRLAYPLWKLAGRRPAPPLGRVDMGHLGETSPICADFGFGRGKPVDRYYIERFLAGNCSAIEGRVLEIGDNSYTQRFGGARVSHSDVLHVHAGNPQASIVGDLATPGVLPPDTFDCIILTQTLHLIYDMRAAIDAIHTALKPGGVALITVPGISQIDRGEWGKQWYWALTPASAERLLGDVFGADNVDVECHGNVYAATTYLQGMAQEEIELRKLDVSDPAYPVTVAVVARKGLAFA